MGALGSLDLLLRETFKKFIFNISVHYLKSEEGAVGRKTWI